MIHDRWSVIQHRYPLLVDRVFVKFLPACNGIKVGLYTFLLSADSKDNSLGTMVILPSQSISTLKETFLLTSSYILPRQTPPQGSTKYSKSVVMMLIPLVLHLRSPMFLVIHSPYTNQLGYHFQVMMISTHFWLTALLSFPTNILLQELFNVLLKIVDNQLTLITHMS